MEKQKRRGGRGYIEEEELARLVARGQRRTSATDEGPGSLAGCKRPPL